ncbi:MAG: hypothetical protein GXP25_13185 [Planctomycetes bacterium]|nr:hypothetical protein [Planctomycetota bacterium]
MSPRTRTIGRSLRKVGVGLFAAYLILAYVLAGLHLAKVCPIHGHHGDCLECRRALSTSSVSSTQISASEDGVCVLCRWIASQTPQPQAAPPVVIRCERIVRSFLPASCPLVEVFERVPSPRGPPIAV